MARPRTDPRDREPCNRRARTVGPPPLAGYLSRARVGRSRVRRLLARDGRGPPLRAFARASGATYIRLISGRCRRRAGAVDVPSMSSMRRSAAARDGAVVEAPDDNRAVPGDTSSGSSRKRLSDRVVVPAGELVVEMRDETERVGILERGPLDDERYRRAGEPERVRRGAVLSRNSPALGIVERRDVAGPGPPQHDSRAARDEPLACVGRGSQRERFGRRSP